MVFEDDTRFYRAYPWIPATHTGALLHWSVNSKPVISAWFARKSGTLGISNRKYNLFQGALKASKGCSNLRIWVFTNSKFSSRLEIRRVDREQVAHFLTRGSKVRFRSLSGFLVTIVSLWFHLALTQLKNIWPLVEGKLQGQRNRWKIGLREPWNYFIYDSACPFPALCREPCWCIRTTRRNNFPLQTFAILPLVFGACYCSICRRLCLQQKSAVRNDFKPLLATYGLAKKLEKLPKTQRNRDDKET